MRSSNIGEVGVQSIRIDGMKIEDLPMAPGAHAKQGLPLAYDTERKNKIENVIARYPKQRVPYLESRIQEAHENIKRIDRTRKGHREEIRRYQELIQRCAGKPSLRDLDPQIREIVKSSRTQATKELMIGTLKTTAAPYDVDGLRRQIAQFDEAIERCDKVIQQEHDSIEEFSEVLGQCRMRDMELKNLNARQAAG